MSMSAFKSARLLGAAVAFVFTITAIMPAAALDRRQRLESRAETYGLLGLFRDTGPRMPQGDRAISSKRTRQLVEVSSDHAPGTILIDTGRRYLYLLQDDGRAYRYGVGVGRDGFNWTGAEKVTRKAEWPDWRPPAEMRKRQPYLPEFVPGGVSNPLGARALYLGNTLYRIHGTNESHTIGGAVSSGCIRMLNADVVDLYDRVNVGTRVVVF